MYFPYLRGKQFELLALRELTALPLDFNKISPIIEPVKKDLKGIQTVVAALNKIKVTIQLIINPEKGELQNSSQEIVDVIGKLHALNFGNVIPTFLINNEKDFILLKNTIYSQGYDKSGYSLIHLNQISSTSELVEITSRTNVINVIIQINHIFALRRKFIKSASLAYLNDPFIKQRKNADYEHYPDENFSNDYLYYSEEGYHGFGDYLTIGSEYIEGGMLPYAVAIHLTYKPRDEEDIRIRHFLSDSNDGIEDTAGKFYEALTKLIQFVDDEGIDSIAIQHFRNYYLRQAFPGLGTLKKLSIMHHIELVQSLL
jgi:hypothetical protein